MEKKKIDRTPPIEMLPCNLCGQKPKLHFSREGKWSCTCPKSHGSGNRATSKLLICQDWNRYNRKEA